MDLSLNWLSEFVDIKGVEPRDFAEKMTMSGSKVEDYDEQGKTIKNVVVGKVLTIEKHPDADKLLVCQIDVGAKQVQIVTGATNLEVGNLVPVALDNSLLPNGTKIKKGKLRGVESFGMLCSLGELNLTANDYPYAVEDGIFVLREKCSPGDDIKELLHLDDTLVEFEITPNRQDCLSVIGLAREAAVTFNKPIKLHTPSVIEDGGSIDELLSVEVKSPLLCPRYMARIVKDIKIEPSPLWMRERLRSMGLRPINNIVDITNYVMLEYGQPMHAFDYNYVKGGRIIVRNADKDESIITLDGVERCLCKDMLVIANEQSAMAVAGVMGGEFSGINENTDTIVFESACFNGPSVRNTSRALSLRTDSSVKFEKGLNSRNCSDALDRACELINMLGAGKVVSGVIDIDNAGYSPVQIKLEPEWINAFIGMNVSREKMIEILTSLGFTVTGDIISVPCYRLDVEHKADIAEEIARFYGYDKIETTNVKGSAAARTTIEQKTETKLNETMLALGYSEIYTFSFISPKYYDKMCVPADSEIRNSLIISNPLGEDTSVMRRFSLPSMLQVLANNYAGRNMSARLYEIATEYIPTTPDALPLEPKKLVIGAYGDDYDYFDLKGTIDDIIDCLNIKDFDIEPSSDFPWYHPGRCAVVKVGDDILGTVGEIHPAVIKNYNIDSRVYAASLSLDALIKHSVPDKEYHTLARFPASSRDLALVCDKDMPVIRIEKTIKTVAEKFIERIELFDVYTGLQIGSNKKSVAYSITLRAPDRTLTDEEIDAITAKILKALEKIDVSLRQ